MQDDVFGKTMAGIRGRSAHTIIVDELHPCPDVDIPDGVEWNGVVGQWEAECQGCHEWTELICDIREVPMEGYEHYCGQNPRCCP